MIARAQFPLSTSVTEHFYLSFIALILFANDFFIIIFMIFVEKDLFCLHVVYLQTVQRLILLVFKVGTLSKFGRCRTISFLIRRIKTNFIFNLLV